jgi:endonuclease-3
LQQKHDLAVKIVHILRAATKDMPAPASAVVAQKFNNDPYLILISCLLSLRARDAATIPVSLALFKHAKTPSQMVRMSQTQLEHIIHSIGFYRHKAQILHKVSQDIIDRFGGKVPDTYDELMSIKGVGPKTANLVLAEAFGHQRLYVDIHVHRISNRLGLIATKTVEQTQQELEKIVPQRLWSEYARLLVTWGQNICVPISPFCSKCPLYDVCKRIGVKRQR